MCLISLTVTGARDCLENSLLQPKLLSTVSQLFKQFDKMTVAKLSRSVYWSVAISV